MISKLHKRRRAPTSELQITAFMNLMVVLVPFLLITAVFSQLAVLELALPEPASESSDEPPLPPGLRVVVRADAVTVTAGDRPVQSFPRAEDGAIDTEALGALLSEIKARGPDETAITLLLEPTVAYEDLVTVMDTVRVQPDDPKQDMFPDIAIGEAAPLNGEAS
ncbi:biopolymer transporter ExbD [Algiphilus sp.]|uniref:ExbD/TolR family protein n=1 Tax=Algiphilus sp. TaxID=1872431 RepID=UPI0025BF733C|nr:biopolymer transporter ExbD [Algiphilus sp.]MBY8966784.1 biopolymer transporter ExbD [Algiphilus acroporae]MCR9090769.1 biopolymer transporter ExbD [Pseudomonadota bacterium]